MVLAGKIQKLHLPAIIAVAVSFSSPSELLGDIWETFAHQHQFSQRVVGQRLPQCLLQFQLSHRVEGRRLGDFNSHLIFVGAQQWQETLLVHNNVEQKIREANERQGTNLVGYKNLQVRYWWGTSKSFYFCGGATKSKETVRAQQC